jgi:hypothetical protein
MQIHKASNLLQKSCVDESRLFFHATPDVSLGYKHAILSGSKKAMGRVTVLCCSNMSGAETWNLLVTGEKAKPRCFKGISMHSLPVQYYTNNNILKK